MSLGIYQRLFDLLQDAAHQLDLLSVSLSTAAGSSSSTYDKFIGTHQELCKVKEECTTLKAKIELAEQCAMYFALQADQAEGSPHFQALAAYFGRKGNDFLLTLNSHIVLQPGEGAE